MSYEQLDRLLRELDFAQERVEPHWLRYQHLGTDTEIILKEKPKSASVRPTDVWSVREHLIRKGLVTEEDLNLLLQQ